MALLNMTYWKDILSIIFKVVLLLQVKINCMGSQINADAYSNITITIKPNGHACLECPVNRSSHKFGMTWKYDNVIIFRDYARTSSYDKLQATINNCSALHETLELLNVLMSFDDVFTCWYNRSEAARFKIDVKGIPLVQIKKDTEIISEEFKTRTRTASNETVQCEVTEAIAPFNITWIINGVRNRSDAVKNSSHFTSTLTIHPTDKTSLICQVQGPSIETNSVTISIVPISAEQDDGTSVSTNDTNESHFIGLIVLVPVLFLASILTSIGLFCKNKRQRTYTTSTKPPSRQTNSDNVDTAQVMTDHPVYDDVSDHDEHPNKDSPTDKVNTQDGYQTTLAICLKTSRMFEYWSATYTKGENKDVKCFAKTLSGSATMNDARSFQELAIALSSLRAHSSIVKLLCISVDELPYSIFYEQLDGGSLRDFMMTHYQGARESHAASTGTGNEDFLQEKMKTELQELIYFASNINKGLRFLSGQKFCHPALCLKKVILSSIGQCKLYDICPLTSAMRKVEELMKKERPPIVWMPPETIFMQEYYQASDVWGYAVLLWELFSFGEIPLARVSDSEIEKQIRGGFILPQPLCCPGAVYGIMLSSCSDRKRERPNLVR
ncbi:uncharacterized protein [Apostichopus japonicus]|uniref:uncharacterized protein isoform X2 n=1 Tax=Stichopus japonicus TaxID=307972 RepID=UPI003AB717D0